jgi:glycosyltransferase involved in cell wall biosynthesis
MAHSLVTPRVSVIVPSFNGLTRGYVRAALRSAVAQTLAAREILFVDDGSRDGTAAAVRAEFPTVTVLEKPNSGPSSARNLGLARAQGELIAFLDDDDVWDERYLEEQVRFLDAHPEIDLVFCGMRVVDEAGRKLRDVLPVSTGLTFPEVLLGNNVLPPSMVVMRAKLAREVGPFDESRRLCEDYDYFIRCAKHGRLAPHAKVLASYRLHLAKSTTDLGAVDDATIEVVDRYARVDLPERAPQLLRFYCYGAALRALTRRDFALARRMFTRAGTPPRPLLLASRLLGMALTPWPRAKESVRRWEYRQVLGPRSSVS